MGRSWRFMAQGWRGARGVNRGEHVRRIRRIHSVPYIMIDLAIPKPMTRISSNRWKSMMWRAMPSPSGFASAQELSAW